MTSGIHRHIGVPKVYINKTKAPFACKTVLCMIVGCANRSGRNNGVYFARVPSVVTNQGKEAENLSRERRSRWISAISRDDLTDDILDRFNVDWVPTLCLAHSKKAVGPKNLEKATEQSQRARDREQISRRNMIIYSRHLKITRHLINMSLPKTRIKLDFTQGCLPSIF